MVTSDPCCLHSPGFTSDQNGKMHDLSQLVFLLAAQKASREMLEIVLVQTQIPREKKRTPFLTKVIPQKQTNNKSSNINTYASGWFEVIIAIMNPQKFFASGMPKEKRIPFSWHCISCFFFPHLCIWQETAACVFKDMGKWMLPITMPLILFSTLQENSAVTFCCCLFYTF